eukprot:scaffold177719_cov41-Prasinocladus_malaysianus.AAC.1
MDVEHKSKLWSFGPAELTESSLSRLNLRASRPDRNDGSRDVDVRNPEDALEGLLRGALEEASDNRRLVGPTMYKRSKYIRNLRHIKIEKEMPSVIMVSILTWISLNLLSFRFYRRVQLSSPWGPRQVCVFGHVCARDNPRRSPSVLNP